jgi:protein-L-isoaspartate O-methyltransferase
MPVLARAIASTAAASIALAHALHVHAQEGEGRAPFFTTPPAVVERMLALAGTGPQDTVIDLGSGDGRIVIAAARGFGARALGIELDENLVRLSRDHAERAGVSGRVAFEHGDVLRADLSRASVVTIYLLGSLMNRLQPKLLAELKPGTRIVSHAFSMTGWNPDRSEIVRLPTRHEGQGDTSRIFLWIVPAQVRGEWRSADSAEGSEWRLSIAQNFQRIEVEASSGGKRLDVKEATLSGVDLSWRAEGVRFRGRVHGGKIVGEIESSRGATPLVLTRR